MMWNRDDVFFWNTSVLLPVKQLTTWNRPRVFDTVRPIHKFLMSKNAETSGERRRRFLIHLSCTFCRDVKPSSHQHIGLNWRCRDLTRRFNATTESPRKVKEKTPTSLAGCFHVFARQIFVNRPNCVKDASNYTAANQICYVYFRRILAVICVVCVLVCCLYMA